MLEGLVNCWKEPKLVVWAIYVLLAPLYVFKSGLPQPGDMFILILVPFALYGWNGKLNKQSLESLRPLIWFTVWVCIVDYAWAFLTGNFSISGMTGYILFPVYYIYNTLIFLVVLVLYRKYGLPLIQLTLYVVMFTIALQVIVTVLFRSTSRGSGLFNNPNQLGYYALLCACFIALVHRPLQAKLWFSTSGLVACGYLAIASASRSSAAGIAILLALLVFSNPRVIVATSLLAVVLFSVGGPVADALEASQRRMELRSQVSQQHGFLEERGYDRIVNYKQYLVLGAGEGGLSRFAETSRIKNMELHSSAGMLLFSYGVVGVALFLAFVYRIVKGARIRMMLFLVPPMLYTVAHQGLRFTMLWILLATFVVLKDPPKPTKTAVIPT